MAKDKEKYSDRIKSLVEETMDKITELLDEFYEEAGDIVKDVSESERVEKLIDKIAEVRKEISEGTADVVKSITRAVVDTGDSIVSLIKKEKDEDSCD
jgi:hypothetical protein